jgi:hypothetical protein
MSRSDCLLAGDSGRRAASLCAVWTIGAAASLLPSSVAAALLPLRIDLDRFDAMKKPIAPPNGQTPGYAELRNPTVVNSFLLHGN